MPSDRARIDKFETVEFSVEDHVATIKLNRPHRRNALNFQAYDELEISLAAVNSDPDVRCAIVTGADPAFCSGDDVGEVLSESESLIPQGPAPRAEPTSAAMRALECTKPLIAAINGPAVGWGMELALFADMRIASQRAKFAELFIRRGLVCDVGGFVRLPAIVGPAKAAELLFTGEVVDADEALRIGLVSKVVEHEALGEAARDLAARIARNPPLALAFMKDGLRRASIPHVREIGEWTTQALYALMKTEDHREGVASFMEKREPVFRGR